MLPRRQDLVHEVLMQVRPLTLASVRAVEATWRPHRVTVGMRAVLAVLVAGPRPVPEVATHLDLTRQAVQRHVNDLLALGLVVTRTNPAHRRSVLIALTDEGHRLWREQHDGELAALATMAAGCSRAELETTARVLAALCADVRERVRELGGDGA